MTDRPERIIDAHIHLWDPARTDWYPYIKALSEHGPGDPTRMARRFDVDAYRSDTAGWNVEKIVNVAAATGGNSVAETLDLERRANEGEGPDAIIGGLPPTDTTAAALELLDKQMEASRFRGVRPMGLPDGPVPAREVLRGLEERDLVFELMCHSDQLEASAKKLAGFEGLSVVVEHTGWPREDTEEERALWRNGIDALAALGPNVSCKLSGLAMPFGSMSVDVFSFWLEYAIDAFGVDRCFFASNFPVDAKGGSFDELYTTFSEVTGSFDAAARDKLFAANAEAIYRF